MDRYQKKEVFKAIQYKEDNALEILKTVSGARLSWSGTNPKNGQYVILLTNVENGKGPLEARLGDYLVAAEKGVLARWAVYPKDKFETEFQTSPF